MKNSILLLGAAAMLAPTGAAAQDRTATVFKPVGPWAVEYADHTCRLIRDFSDGKAQITLAFERFGLRPTFDLGLAGDGLRTFTRPRKVGLRFNNSPSAQTGSLARAVLADGRNSYLVSSVILDPALRPGPDQGADATQNPVDRESELSVAASITAISFESGFVGRPVLETGNLQAPFAALHACTDDLLVSLGIDPIRMATHSKAAEPIGGMERWARSIQANYPREMIRAGRDGMVSLRLVISAEGQVESCFVGVTEQGPFEKTVCQNALQQAFTPALDAAGQPIRSYKEVTVVYM